MEEDTFGYEVKVPDRPATRRGLLSALSSVYDPLGFISPVVLQAKILLQEACQQSLAWDDPLPDELAQQWFTWLEAIPRVREIDIPRCFKPIQTLGVAQLHHFADGSSKAYGAVTYLRTVDKCGISHVKAKLAPLTAQTIPRIELMAAVEAVKLDNKIRGELELALCESVFWTDSTIVLWYLAHEEKRFQTFVANRVSLILESTKPTQWSHARSRDNPADDCSRGLSATDLHSSDRWFGGGGLQFLLGEESQWPTSPIDQDTPPIEAEVKANLQVFATEGQTIATIDNLIEKYSSWHRLRKAVAWMLRFKSYIQNRVMSDGPALLSPDELYAAEVAIILIVGSIFKYHFEKTFKAIPGRPALLYYTIGPMV